MTGGVAGLVASSRATHVDGDLWVLNGFKWFCSNVDAQAIATLARPEGGPEGTGGIALFVVPRVRVERALGDGDDHPLLSPICDAIRSYRTELEAAVAYVAAAPKDVARLHPRRITRSLTNLVSAALLTEQAGAELKDRGSARKAAVAKLYANVHLGARPLGSIGADDHIVLEGFDAITRYGEPDPDRLAVGVS